MRATRAALPSEKPALCGVTMTSGSVHSGESAAQRLVREDIEEGAGQAPLLQRRDQRGLVDALAARHVDEPCARRQRSQRRGVDQRRACAR